MSIEDSHGNYHLKVSNERTNKKKRDTSIETNGITSTQQHQQQQQQQTGNEKRNIETNGMM